MDLISTSIEETVTLNKGFFNNYYCLHENAIKIFKFLVEIDTFNKHFYVCKECLDRCENVFRKRFYYQLQVEIKNHRTIANNLESIKESDIHLNLR